MAEFTPNLTYPRNHLFEVRWGTQNNNGAIERKMFINFGNHYEQNGPSVIKYGDENYGLIVKMWDGQSLRRVNEVKGWVELSTGYPQPTSGMDPNTIRSKYSVNMYLYADDGTRSYGD